MIAGLIDFCGRNRLLVLILTAFLVMAGIWTIFNIRLDAIPDLSDVQVIVFTEYEGQAPQVVEDQVTYPLTTAMLSVPYSKLGPLAGAGIPQLCFWPAAQGSYAADWAGCNRCGLGVRVRPAQRVLLPRASQRDVSRPRTPRHVVRQV